MTLEEKLRSDFQEAQRAHNAFRAEVFRSVFAAIQNRSIENRSKGGGKTSLTDEEVLEIIAKEAKKRKEAAVLFREGSRTELAEKEEKELRELERYLPQPLSLEELHVVIHDVLQKFKGDATQNNFGKIMGEVMRSVKGRADASQVGTLLKEALEKERSDA